jgi:peptidoglycan pentaglycine glycine transferase (the first glycine)
MKTVLFDTSRKEEWDALAIKEPFIALFQSWQWGEFKEKCGWKVFRIGVEENCTLVAGAQMLIKPLPFKLSSIAYIPRGPIGNWLDKKYFQLIIDEASRIAQKNQAIFLRIEPALCSDPEMSNIFANHQFTESAYTNHPKATIIMNIAGSLDDILGSMRTSTRRKISYAQRKGITFCEGGSDEMPAFYELMRITSERTGFTLKPYDYYLKEFEVFRPKNQVGFFLAYYQGNFIAAHIAYAFGNHAAFFHQASSREFANLNANCLLVWEEIKWAKNLGCCTYDLWGIPEEICDMTPEEEKASEEELTNGLWGVYKFKRGFSKNSVFFAGAFDQVYKHGLYSLMIKRLSGEETIEKALAFWDGFSIKF